MKSVVAKNGDLTKSRSASEKIHRLYEMSQPRAIANGCMIEQPSFPAKAQDRPAPWYAAGPIGSLANAVAVFLARRLDGRAPEEP